MRTKQKLNQKLAAALYEDAKRFERARDTSTKEVLKLAALLYEGAKRFGRARGMSTKEVLAGRLDETWDEINVDAETLRTLAIEGLTRRIVEARSRAKKRRGAAR